ncbi:hypothetical protein [Fusobacterium varium]|mgnify:FL=1|uniref:hypothetical protein n=1 Tax=Fusobacterium varium TaxID=856 RepID=UPI000BBA70EA|nr:hypothetical protein [uncultured Fusobacterium sp.]BBA51083.1 hypothetical protein FV113G1_14320 [Fusobacterium varium]
MKKICGIVSIIAAGILITGCNDTGNKNTNNVSAQITLTEKEKQKDKDEVARILVYKALLEEVKKAEFSPEELENIQIAQNQIKINYFIERELKNKTQITDEEAADFYKRHKEQFDDKPLEEMLPILYKSLAVEKYNQAQVEYYNSIIEKYKLNDILKKEGIIKDEQVEKIDGKEVEKI